MRILIIHSRYSSGPSSGENATVRDEAKLLSGAGHDVHTWQPGPDLGRLQLGMRTIWSRDATRELKRLMRQYRPEVVHVHNLFPMLSPAILRAPLQHSAVVMTLHNYRLMCLPATFLRDGATCELCSGHQPWRGVQHRCFRGSFLGSAALATSLSTHRAIGSFEKVHIFIAVSRFVADKHITAGFPADRIRVKPNFAWGTTPGIGPGDYFLIMTRLSAEKDVATVLRAWRPEFGRLVVVGDGPEAAGLRQEAPLGVEFKGAVPADDAKGILREARALLLPSVSYEGWPKSVSEAFAAGVPVIANRIGSLPEAVQDGSTGVLVPPRDASAWEGALRRLLDDVERTRMGEKALRVWQDRLSPERGLADLEAAYEAALASR